MTKVRKRALVTAAALLLVVPGATAGTQHEAARGEQFEPPARIAKSGELDSALTRVSRAAAKPAQAIAVAQASAIDVRDGDVRVTIETEQQTARVAAAVEAAGGEVEGAYGSLVQALVPPAALMTLAGRADVDRIDRPAEFFPTATPGEGVGVVKANLSQAAGFDGTGVKIAVIDGGFAGVATRQASGDLPGALTTQNYCADGFAAGGDHGTGVAEIVHEIAPAAQLYLVCADTIVGLGQAKDYAVANDIDVINMSGGYFNSGDGSGTATGIFASMPDGIVKAARDAGIVWVNAAGNEALTHWAGVFTDPDGDTVLDFTAADEGQSFVVPAGETACAFLRWQAWPGSGVFSDYDLYVTNSTSGAIVAASEGDQLVVEPVEDGCFTNSGPTQAFAAHVVHWDGSTSPAIDLFVIGTPEIEYQVADGSLIEPAASPSVLAVGAVCWDDGWLQPYSSRGRVASAEIKPDVVGPDGVSSGTYGAAAGCDGGFTGTSAASPHVAGLVAILKEQVPARDAAELETAVVENAVDLDRPGADSATGYGLAEVPNGAPTLLHSWAYPPNETPALTLQGAVTSPVAGTYHWQYGPTTAYGTVTPTRTLAAGTQPTNENVTLAGSGTYHARLVATTAYGTTFGPDEVVTAPIGPPSVSTLPPSVVSGTTATLDAYGSANGSISRVDFELGRTIAYGTAVTGQSIGSGRGVGVGVQSPALEPGTTYHYRAVARNADGQVTYGRDVSFTTAEVVYGVVTPPSVTIDGGTAVGSTLTAQAGAWTSDSPDEPIPALEFQWLQCRSNGELCAPIGGATQQTYAPAAADIGKSLRVAVTGSIVWHSVTMLSDRTAPVSTPVAPPPVGGGGSGGGSSGGTGGGGGSSVPNLSVKLGVSRTAVAPSDTVDVTVTVANGGGAGALQTRLVVYLPATATLLGRPAYDRGSGCNGTDKLECFLDYVPNGGSTRVLFSLRLHAPGQQQVIATVNADRDANTSDNMATLAIQVGGAAGGGGGSAAPTVRRAPKARAGTAGSNTLTGTIRNDVIRGLGGNDRLYGRGGSDTLVGGPGNDLLDGGAGSDRLVAGAGNDTVKARDGRRDSIDCGPGRDSVTADRADVVRGCERIARH